MSDAYQGSLRLSQVPQIGAKEEGSVLEYTTDDLSVEVRCLGSLS